MKILLLFFTTAICLNATDLSSLLTLVDSYRGLSSDYYVEMHIAYFEAQELQSQKQLGLWVSVVSEPRDVLLRYLAPANERNNLILSKGHNMWVQNRRTSRPVPISMSQRLLGDASVGDAINIELSGNYNGAFTESGDTTALSLVASTPSQLYKKIEMKVNTRNGRPIEAHFLTANGKILKKAFYTSTTNFEGESVVNEIIIVDGINESRVTKISFSHFQKQTLPATHFNKNGLSSIRFE